MYEVMVFDRKEFEDESIEAQPYQIHTGIATSSLALVMAEQLTDANRIAYSGKSE